MVIRRVRDAPERGWFVYILKSATVPKFYTGITPDLERRLRKHNGELVGGARFTRTGRPWTIAYSEGPLPLNDAMRREHVVKKMSRQAKALLCVRGIHGVSDHRDSRSGGR